MHDLQYVDALPQRLAVDNSITQCARRKFNQIMYTAQCYDDKSNQYPHLRWSAAFYLWKTNVLYRRVWIFSFTTVRLKLLVLFVLLEVGAVSSLVLFSVWLHLEAVMDGILFASPSKEKKNMHDARVVSACLIVKIFDVPK